MAEYIKREGGKKYSIIYADPPWTFKTYSTKGAEKKSAQAHYDCMTLEDIKALRVDAIADKDCVLFMWATYPMLSAALETIKAWGFEYKTIAFTWVKRNKKTDSWFMGCGFWTRSNAEICLLATRGHPRRVSTSVRQIVDAPVMEHSRKPDEVRDRIVQLLGDVPRIELFARQTATGWDCIGNEIDGTDIRDFLKEE